MKTILKKILQPYANYLIEKLEKTDSQKDFDFWYNQALQLEYICSSLNIHLD